MLVRIIIVIAWVAFFVNGLTVLDPDFGWHLRMGEIIMEKGIPKEDPFSYTMPSYPFIDHEWLTNVFIERLYITVGLLGLSVITATLAVLSVILQARTFRKYTILPILLGFATLLPFVMVRPQVITWFFFSVLTLILFSEKLWSKWRYGVPLLFLLWVNMHGGFAAGIFTLFAVVLLRTLQGRKIVRKDLFVVLLCIFVTFINPYGMRVWWEIWMQISDSNLRWTIAEWIPMIFTFHLTFWVFLPLSFFFVWRYRVRYSRPQLFLYVALLIASLSSVRHAPLWIIVTVPLTIQAFLFLSQEAGKHRDGAKRANQAFKVFSFLVFIAVVLQVVSSYKSVWSFREEAFYPRQAVLYLHNSPPKGELYSYYGWGGYLIWKLPEKKVFIDGRMPSWRWDGNYQGESDYVFREYENLQDGTIPFQVAVRKYNIDTVLLPVSVNTSRLSFLDGLRSLILRGNEEIERPTISSQLLDAGWTEIFRDSISVIYQRKS